MASHDNLYIGLMSGTSLDGVDGVLARFSDDSSEAMSMLASAHLPFPPALRDSLMALQQPGQDELHREALAGNALADQYRQCVSELLRQSDLAAQRITAVGVHGQTIRHRPECGYTWQTGNPALLAELCEIDVVADLRSRDIAAGGQGAPLVPAFHRAVFSKSGETRAVVNIGGIGNVSILDAETDGVVGFDTGPGNVLLDTWTRRNIGKDYDADGAWAATGKLLPDLLEELKREPYLSLPPPKSTGRDLFHEEWLDRKLQAFRTVAPEDVQATLTAFTAATIAQAIARYSPHARAVFVCGGGAYNHTLMNDLQGAVNRHGIQAKVESTAVLGVSPNHVEALAFAWLACRFVRRLPGNLPSVTGAKGPRILGALYPA